MGEDYVTPEQVKAIVDTVPQAWVWGEDTLHTVIATVLNHNAPRRALFGVLDVVPRQDYDVAVRQWEDVAGDYERMRDRAERWEVLLRDLDPYCPTGCGTCPDCRALQVVERVGQGASDD